MIVGRVCGHYELTSPVVPVRDTFLPEQKLVELRISAVGGSCGLTVTTAAGLLLQRNSVPSTHIRCRITARRLATRDNRTPHATPLRYPHAPCFQPRPFAGAGKQRLRSLIEHRT